MAPQIDIQTLFVLSFARSVYAKFSVVYQGIATAGRDTCTLNLTQYQIEKPSSCGAIFRCILTELDNYDQAILSSGNAILGFIPTVVTLLSATDDDLLRIHAEYPILAFLLSITNISTTNPYTRTIRPVEIKRLTDTETASSLDAQQKDLGPHNHIIPLNRNSSDSHATIIVYHLTALAGAAVVIWQTIDLGQKAVLTWACWTEFYPALWVLLGTLQHILAVCCLRLSLRDSADPRNTSLGIWQPQLTTAKLDLELAHPKFAHWAKACVELLSNVTFLYGTVVFSSLSLVSGVNAIKVLVVYGFVPVFTRIMAAMVIGRQYPTSRI
ncbi:hypothetical protein BDV96DRAFT_589992 [Lophiotrema nucula]|uniref:Uncharacterized protein n=1 Tax=Lophiotrema nucula TaxID=690887 RepID=A0A6A5YLD7_9PLEO|nr:hypothetical protein BDV96DRAFT_589992 [Lophiotrema nucula]